VNGTTIVGYSYGTNGIEAVFWDANGIHQLEVVLAGLGLDLTGWALEVAADVSWDGQTIVGWGRHNGQQEGWIAVIPEPSTGSLVCIGLAALCARRRVRREL
jgi:hypothetical protein